MTDRLVFEAEIQAQRAMQGQITLAAVVRLNEDIQRVYPGHIVAQIVEGVLARAIADEWLKRHGDQVLALCPPQAIAAAVTAELLKRFAGDIVKAVTDSLEAKSNEAALEETVPR